MKRLLVILSIAALVGCGKKEEPPISKVAAQPTTPTVDQALDAVLRAHPNALQACYDSKLNGFFLDYGPLLPAGVADDNKFHGWWIFQNVNYYQSENNSWFIADQPAKDYTQVYPVIDGLSCKQH